MTPWLAANAERENFEVLFLFEKIQQVQSPVKDALGFDSPYIEHYLCYLSESERTGH